MHDPDLSMGRRFGYIQCIAANLVRLFFRGHLQTERYLLVSIPWTVLEHVPAKSESDDAQCLSLALSDSHVMLPLSAPILGGRESWNAYVPSCHRRLSRLHTGMPTDEAGFL